MHQGNNGLKFWELVHAKCIDNAVPGRGLMVYGDVNGAACAVCVCVGECFRPKTAVCICTNAITCAAK